MQWSGIDSVEKRPNLKDETGSSCLNNSTSVKNPVIVLQHSVFMKGARRLIRPR